MDAEDEARGQRLIRARLAKRISRPDAVKRLRVPYSTYALHEQGRRGFKAEAERYAQFYGVRLEWLWAEQGPMKQGQKDQVLELYEKLPPEKKTAAIDYLKYLQSLEK